MVQWLKLHAPNEGGMGLIPGWGTKISHGKKKNVAHPPAALDSPESLIEMQNFRPCHGHTGEGDDRGWDGWMASLTQWTWVWTPGIGDGQGSLACCSPWGHKESDRTEQLNWTERTLMHMQWEVLEFTFHWVVRAKKFACGCGASTTLPVWFLLCSWTHPSLHKAIFLFILNFYLFIYLFIF